MPDIQLRLDKDVLVMSTPVDYALKNQGFVSVDDKLYVSLCEPELIEEAFKIESVMETPVFVAPTEEMTGLYLAHARFDGRSAELVEHVYEAMAPLKPEHLVAAIGPSGAPLDESSAPSLRQSRMLYQDAVRVLTSYPFEGVFFSGFSNPYDLQCALMGARAVYDGIVFASLSVNEQGALTKNYDLARAIALADEYGSDVIGVRAALSPDELKPLIAVCKGATDKPLLVELEVTHLAVQEDLRARVVLNPQEQSAYYDADTFVQAGLELQQLGVQFVRGVGDVTPAYTAALLACLAGRSVVL